MNLQLGNWDSLVNVALCLLWLRIWADDRDMYFNPYLAVPGRLVDSILKFIKPALFGMPARQALWLMLVLIVLIRGLLVPPSTAWIVNWGLVSLKSIGGAVGPRVIFSLISFAAFLLKLWTISVIYVFVNRSAVPAHANAALDRAARPFTRLKPELRPAVLVCSAILLLAAFHAVSRTGDSALPSLTGEPAPVFLFRAIILALAGLADVLRVIGTVLMLLVFGSLFGALAGSARATYMCREWIDLLIGPMRHHPLIVGMFDLSPIIVFFVINIAHSLLMRALKEAFLRLGG